MARIEGLYAITPELSDTDTLLTKVERALEGGASAVQYRAKRLSLPERARQARLIAELCRAHCVPLIINDDLELALTVGAAGVHLGENDPPLAAAKAQLGREAIIGISCYNRFELAIAAQEQGASYAAFGSFFSSPTKPHAMRADVELLRRAKRELALPVVAIGGITLANASDLIAAGAHSIAVVSALFDAPDIKRAAAEFTQLFRGNRVWHPETSSYSKSLNA